ncbi:MAG TPA: M3 family metallopeptidase, partial [Sphingobacterium sp.]|nr:M3 family metallopeptidase [Sphingobacterium sp.]
MHIKLLPLFIMMVVMITACNDLTENKMLDNPFLTDYDTPFEVPPFDKIKNSHFEPAFEEGLKNHNKEIDSIVQMEEEPNFENTIVALENSGKLLGRVSRVFYNLNSANTNDEIQDLAKELAPRLSAHWDEIYLNEGLFERVKNVYDNQSNFNLESEDRKLLEETYKGFVRSGANLSDQDKEKLKEINSKISELTTDFGQNLLAETNDFQLFIDEEEELSGLPESLKEAARESAVEAGQEDKWLFTLQNASIMPFLQYADNRELRRKIWEAYQQRGNNENEHDNKEILLEISNLRLEKAKLIGYSSHAAYVLEEAMAKNSKNVDDILQKMWKPALAKAKQEAEDLQEEINNRGEPFELAPYDWRYYTEKIRQKRYALSEDEMRPYFSLSSVREGAFETAAKLYGLSFVALNNVPTYHEDVEVYEVKDRDGSHLGLLYMDFFPRASKRGGAWMTSYRSQSKKNGERQAPIISLVCNFTKPSGGKPSLLTFDEATTLFHEFGHGLHGLLSDVKYESLSGTSVPRDFVEMPSQIMENWAADPEVMQSYAKHYETNKVIPDSLIQKLADVATFDQGFATTEYLAASFLDMTYHAITEPIEGDVNEIEREAMDAIGLIDAIIPRYRSSYFQHVFSGGYSSGYYSYIWSEVLDADAFAAFKET